MERAVLPAFTCTDMDGFVEHGAGIAEGVEFSVLGTSINFRRQFCYKSRVVGTAQKGGIQLVGVDAGYTGAEAGSQHRPRQSRCIGRRTEEWEERFDSGICQQLDAVVSNILQKQIPKRHVRYAGFLRLTNRYGHPFLIQRIGARPGKWHGP